MTNRPPVVRLNHFASDSEIESHSISGLVLDTDPEWDASQHAFSMPNETASVGGMRRSFDAPGRANLVRRGKDATGRQPRAALEKAGRRLRGSRLSFALKFNSLAANRVCLRHRWGS